MTKSDDSIVKNWELVKENAAPLERGRNASTLVKSLAFSSHLSGKFKEDDEEIRYYESLIRPSENFSTACMEIINLQGQHSLDPNTVQDLILKHQLDQDPLIPWLRYVKYHEEKYPSDTHTQFLLMERCTKALIHIPRYADDTRFVRVCVLYADRTSNPNETFISFHQNKIGVQTTIFWLAWAWIAEKKEDFAFAEKIFRKGISKNAKPLNVLELRYKQFQRRMNRHFLNSAARIQNDDVENNCEPNRKVLGSITQENVRYNQRSTNLILGTSAAHSRQQNHNILSASQKAKDIRIFVDGGSDDDEKICILDASSTFPTSAVVIMTKEEDKKKENVAAIERWNERGGLQSHKYDDDMLPTPATGPTVAQRWSNGGVESRLVGAVLPRTEFAIFVEEEFASKQQKEPPVISAPDRDDSRTLRNKLDGHMTEVSVPCSASTDVYQQNVPSGTSLLRVGPEKVVSHLSQHEHDRAGRHGRKSKTNGLNPSVIVNEIADRNHSFEESRALQYAYKLISSANNFNFLAHSKDSYHENDDSYMDVDEMSTFNSDLHDTMSSLTSIDRLRLTSCKDNSKSGVLRDSAFMVSEEQNMIDDKQLFSHRNISSSLCESYYQNASTTSSSINENDAVGYPGDKEETINTRLAARELSMMFTSPGVDDHPTPETRKYLLGQGHNISLLSSKKYSDCKGLSEIDTGLIHHRSAGATSVLNGNPPLHDDNARKQVMCQTTKSRTGEITVYTSPSMCENKKSTRRSPSTRSPLKPHAGSLPSGDETQSQLDKKRERDQANVEQHNQSRSRYCDDTASIGDIEVLMRDLGSELSDSKRLLPVKVRQPNYPLNFENCGIAVDSIDAFGDISAIVSDDTELIFKRQNTFNGHIDTSVDYEELHQSDIERAMLSIKTNTPGHYNRSVFNCTNRSLSINLTKGPIKGAELEIGDLIFKVKNELGRGVYGTVILCSLFESLSRTSREDVALKLQRPTGSLALEYSILQKIELRLSSAPSSCEHHNVIHPFPRPITFALFKDGGILGMTAGSDSGFNLVDVVNAHKRSAPEDLAIYYTARMIAHLETLHFHCGILHCDVKPDNWVLTVSSLKFSEADVSTIILGGDLMLVDYGRSVDITTINQLASDNVLLRGKVAAEDMECIAMRQGKAWGADIDTFGLLASSHVLLFGSHIEVEMDPSSRRYRLKHRFRRYWQQDLWSSFFDTFLNLDPGLIHSEKLAEQRKRFETQIIFRFAIYYIFSMFLILRWDGFRMYS